MGQGGGTVSAATGAIRQHVGDVVGGWNRFWFTPADPAVLSLIRICTGMMLFYTHLVWSLDLDAFFSQQGWLAREVMDEVHGESFTWSYFWWIKSSGVLWTVHIAALIVFALLTIGYRSRLMSVLAYVAAVSYVNRVSPGAFFGLDKINCLLAMYLMLGPSGARYSVDRWLARRRAGDEPLPPVAPSVGANVAIRMIQLHMCIIYLFAGLGKLQGTSWWDGSATWMTVANLEYQSFDMTWLAGWPKLVSLLTHATVFWELFFAALIWGRYSRPWMLLGAVAVHGGIAMFMGMITFGLVMLIGNMAFFSAGLVRAICDPVLGREQDGRL